MSTTTGSEPSLRLQDTSTTISSDPSLHPLGTHDDASRADTSAHTARPYTPAYTFTQEERRSGARSDVTKYEDLISRLDVISRFSLLLKRLNRKRIDEDDMELIEYIFDQYVENSWDISKYTEAILYWKEKIATLTEQIDKLKLEKARILTDLTLRFNEMQSFTQNIMNEYRRLPNMSYDDAAEEDDPTCCICKINKSQIDIILSCGHKGILCATCIYMLFGKPTSELKCPLCRKYLFCALRVCNSNTIDATTQYPEKIACVCACGVELEREYGDVFNCSNCDEASTLVG